MLVTLKLAIVIVRKTFVGKNVINVVMAFMITLTAKFVNVMLLEPSKIPLVTMLESVLVM